MLSEGLQAFSGNAHGCDIFPPWFAKVSLKKSNKAMALTLTSCGTCLFHRRISPSSVSSIGGTCNPHCRGVRVASHRSRIPNERHTFVELVRTGSVLRVTTKLYVECDSVAPHVRTIKQSTRQLLYNPQWGKAPRWIDENLAHSLSSHQLLWQAYVRNGARKLC